MSIDTSSLLVSDAERQQVNNYNGGSNSQGDAQVALNISNRKRANTLAVPAYTQPAGGSQIRFSPGGFANAGDVIDGQFLVTQRHTMPSTPYRAGSSTENYRWIPQ